MAQRITVTAEAVVVDHAGDLGNCIEKVLTWSLSDCQTVNIAVKYEREGDDAES